jgi:hypothetical protein
MFDLIGATLRCRKTQLKTETPPALLMLGLALGRRRGTARERHGRGEKKCLDFTI